MKSEANMKNPKKSKGTQKQLNVIQKRKRSVANGPLLFLSSFQFGNIPSEMHTIRLFVVIVNVYSVVVLLLISLLDSLSSVHYRALFFVLIVVQRRRQQTFVLCLYFSSVDKFDEINSSRQPSYMKIML